MIVNRDRREWANHPVTLEFLEMLRETRQTTMEAWARGNFTAENADGTLQKNAEAIGGLSVLDQTLDIIDGWASLDPETEQLERVL